MRRFVPNTGRTTSGLGVGFPGRARPGAVGYVEPPGSDSERKVVVVDAGLAARLRQMEAVVFDMDGVVAETAGLHARAWEVALNEYLQRRSAETGEPFRPYTGEDYLWHVEGRPRPEGVAAFLQSRGISLAEGEPDDPSEEETIRRLGNRKNRLFLQLLEEGRAGSYLAIVDLIEELRAEGIAVAMITSSRHVDEVLGGTGGLDLFPVKVDGVDSARLGLAGKPEPDVLIEACRRLRVGVDRAAVVEDAVSGVEAGRRGGFAMVVGVDRGGQAAHLVEAGADVVVADLSQLLAGRPIAALPSALDEAVAGELAGHRPAVFLDYDGTLTPIVSHPRQATLPGATREVLARLAALVPVAVVSGRDRAEVEEIVGLPQLVYAGSHGFDISGPDGLREVRGSEVGPTLTAAADELEEMTSGVAGAWVERKRFAVAVHFRDAPPDAGGRLREMVDRVAMRHQDLRVSGGKKVLELRPDLDWDKGRAVLWLLDVLDLTHPEVVPLYLGDDETDEDVFRVLRGRGGIGVVVGDEDRRSLARYLLRDTDQVREFLAWLADWSGR